MVLLYGELLEEEAAAISDYKYSDALVNFKKDWNRETLFYFLENPRLYKEVQK